jgi:hypothetical protein
MTGWPQLDAFLQTNPRDVGCDEAMRILHVYVDAVLERASPDERYPGVAAHLRACGPCGADFEGLLRVVERDRN